jgi:hypothetical protein
MSNPFDCSQAQAIKWDLAKCLENSTRNPGLVFNGVSESQNETCSVLFFDVVFFTSTNS